MPFALKTNFKERSLFTLRISAGGSPFVVYGRGQGEKKRRFDFTMSASCWPCAFKVLIVLRVVNGGKLYSPVSPSYIPTL